MGTVIHVLEIVALAWIAGLLGDIRNELSRIAKVAEE